MNFTKKIMLVLTSILLFNLALTAQVTIGSGHAPREGALLDLKQDNLASGANSTKGLLLPRVQLKSETIILPTAEGEEVMHTGLMVYHIGNSECAFGGMPKGVYLWNGLKWVYLHDTDDSVKDVDTAIYIETVSSENLAGTIQSLKENSKYILRGHAKGQGVTYQWSKDNTLLDPTATTHGEYEITKLVDADEGVYTCTMFDDCDASLTQSIEILIGERDCLPVDFELVAHDITNGAMIELTKDPISGAFLITKGSTDRIQLSVKLKNSGVLSDYTYSWTTDTGEIVGAANGDKCIVKIPVLNNVLDNYTVTITDPNCTVPTPAQTIFLRKDVDCSSFDVTNMRVFNNTGEIQAVGGIYTVRGDETLYIQPTIKGSTFAKTTITWTASMGNKVPTKNSSTSRYDLIGGVGSNEIYQIFSWKAVSENDCESNGTIHIQTINPDCTIGDIFSTSDGFLIKSTKNNWLWVVPKGKSNPIINSSAIVTEWNGTSHTENITVAEETRRPIKVTVNGCPGTITLVAQGANHGNCTSPGSESMTAAYASSTSGSFNEVDIANYRKAYSLYPFVSISNTNPKAAHSPAYITLWYKKESTISPRITPLNYVSGGGNVGYPLVLPEKTLIEDEVVEMQVIQADSGCSTIRDIPFRR